MHSVNTMPPIQLERLLAAAAAALEGYADTELGAVTDGTFDAGPPLLASLAAEAGLEDTRLVRRVLERWLAGTPEQPRHLGAFDGLASFFLGARAASSLHPRFEPLATTLTESLSAWSAANPWRTSSVGWADYDLITGPAGIVLALSASPDTAAQALPAARHLAVLCDHDDLIGLRLVDDGGDERRSWSVGLVNTGLAHGITGVIAALSSMVERAPGGDEFIDPLRRASSWLGEGSYIDQLGLLTWPLADLTGNRRPQTVSRRQAWCYGTPGIAWTLWDAGRVLGDLGLQTLAEDAMRSFCTVFDERRYIDDGPVGEVAGICHGAAGTLAVAEAFALHAGIPAAGILRNRLLEFLADRLTEVQELGKENMSLLTGAAGVLAVLLTCEGGKRGWLAQIALR